MTAGLKKTVFYIYISLVIHAYLIFLISRTIDPDILTALAHPERVKLPETQVENIIVETKSRSEQIPEKGKISDKPNQGTSPITGETENYNVYNPNQSENPGKPGQPGSQPDKPEAETQDGTEAENKAVRQGTENPVPGGNPAPSLFDPDRAPDVIMNSSGQLSLATVPAEYAEYFLEMQKKIGENWRNFFPVFQYYTGILKSGEVTVDFGITGNGDVIDPRVTGSYGYQILDESSLNAVRYSQNFGPLPDSLKKEGLVKIRFRFIYISR